MTSYFNRKMSQIEIYQALDNTLRVRVVLENETVWLTQKDMTNLFGRIRVTITEHISSVFKERELEESSACRKFRHATKDVKFYGAQYYNLDVIISAGYRVKSKQDTQFSVWATQQRKMVN